MTGQYDMHDKIQRPEYCGCELPWQTATGPLKDGSHFSDCVGLEVGQELEELHEHLRFQIDRATKAETERDRFRGEWHDQAARDGGKLGEVTARAEAAEIALEAAEAEVAMLRAWIAGDYDGGNYDGATADPMAKYVEGMPDELRDMLRGWSDRIARDAALDHPEIARAADQGNRESAVAKPQVTALDQSDGARANENLLDVPDQPEPTCLVDHGSCFAPDCDCWCHAPIEGVPDQPNPTAAPPSICTADGPANPPVCGEVCRYCPIPTTDEGKAEYDRRFRALTEEGET